MKLMRGWSDLSTWSKYGISAVPATVSVALAPAVFF